MKRRIGLADLQTVPRSIRTELRHAGNAICAVLAMAARGNRADRRPQLRAIELTLKEIADRSGTSPSSVRVTIDKLEAMGVLTNQDDRKAPDGRNLPNRVVIVCKAWIAWLVKRYGLGGSFFKCASKEKGLSLTLPVPLHGASGKAAAPFGLGSNSASGASPPIFAEWQTE